MATSNDSLTHVVNNSRGGKKHKHTQSGRWEGQHGHQQFVAMRQERGSDSSFFEWISHPCASLRVSDGVWMMYRPSICVYEVKCKQLTDGAMMAKTTLCYYLLKSNCLLRYTYVPGQSLFSPFPFGEQKHLEIK